MTIGGNDGDWMTIMWYMAIVVVITLIIVGVLIMLTAPKDEGLTFKVRFGDSNKKVINELTQEHAKLKKPFSLTAPAGAKFIMCGLFASHKANKFWTPWQPYAGQKNVDMKYEFVNHVLTASLDLTDTTLAGADRTVTFKLV